MSEISEKDFLSHMGTLKLSEKKLNFILKGNFTIFTFTEKTEELLKLLMENKIIEPDNLNKTTPYQKYFKQIISNTYNNSKVTSINLEKAISFIL